MKMRPGLRPGGQAVLIKKSSLATSGKNYPTSAFQPQLPWLQRIGAKFKALMNTIEYVKSLVTRLRFKLKSKPWSR